MTEVRREWLEKDYYAVLGVSEGASAKEITRAYRDLARELHPDRNPDNEKATERFKEVSAAYDVLKDAESRKAYDQVRKMGPMAGGFGPGPGGGPGGGGFSFDFEGGDIGDLLGNLFGGGFGGRGRGGPRPGRDQEAQISLSFDEAVAGVTTTVAVGGGAGGSRRIKIRIPAGVTDGQRIRLRGKGGPGANGGPAGDLYVVVRVGDHPLFGRDGRDLTVDVPVTFPEAALGATVKVPTFDGGTVSVKVPPGTQPGRTMRVRGRGIETSDGIGDLLVTVTVAVPDKLTSRQRKALEDFAATIDESPRDRLGRS